MKNIICILAFLLAAFNLVLADEKTLVYDNFIYEEQVKTVILQKLGSDDPNPVISLHSMDRLKLQFDELKNNNDYFQYTFVHCNSLWEPSDLQSNEYLKGINFENINDFKFSTNTFQRYVHYSVVFPTADMRPLLSGNYILKVYRNFDESDLIITRKFMVVDKKVTIHPDIKGATNIESRFSKQEVDFTVNYKNIVIPNPFTDVKAVICQNNRWDNAISNLRPMFVNNNELIYNYEKGNLFEGGKEFRFFDIRSLRFFSQNIASKYFDSASRITNVFVKPEDLRSHLQYFQYVDFNGKRVVDNKDGKNKDVDGDYALVHFFLNSNNPLPDDVYILGELSDWRAQGNFKMNYNRKKKGYEASVLLKQGYYSYIYTTFNQNENVLETIFTEGNNFETENDYYIYIYLRNQFLDYDELIGVEHANTRTIQR